MKCVVCFENPPKIQDEIGKSLTLLLSPSIVHAHAVAIQLTAVSVHAKCSWRHRGKANGPRVLSAHDVEVVVCEAIAVAVLHVEGTLLLVLVLLLLLTVDGRVAELLLLLVGGIVDGFLLLGLLLGEVGLKRVGGNIGGGDLRGGKSVAVGEARRKVRRVSGARVLSRSKTARRRSVHRRRVGLVGKNALARRVSATVLAKVDLEPLVLLAVADGLDGLDGVGDVGEVDERTALLAKSVDELNLTILGKVLAETLLAPRLVKVTDIDVPGRTAGYSKGNGWWESTRVLAPSNLETTVVDHQALEVAEGIEAGSRGGVNEGDEANVLVGDITNVVKETSTNDIANLLDGRLGVDVAKINGPVAQVVDSTSRGSDSSRSDGLLGKGGGDDLPISSTQHMRETRSNSQVLGSVLLLSLGDICTPVLAVVHPARRLPLGLLGKLGNGLDGIGNRQEVDETNGLLTDQLDGIDGSKLAQILTDLVLANVLRKVSKIDVPRGTRLLDRQGDGGWHWGRLAPSDLDILAPDSQLLQDGIRVEMGGRGAVQEGDEGAVLVGEETDGLDLSGTNVAQDLLGGGLGRDVSEVDGAGAARDNSRGCNHGRGSTRVLAIVVGILGGEPGRRSKARASKGRRHDRGTAVLLLEVVERELRRGKGLGGTGLEGRAEEQLRRQQWRKLHVIATWGANSIISIHLALQLALELARVDGRNIHAPTTDRLVESLIVPVGGRPRQRMLRARALAQVSILHGEDVWPDRTVQGGILKNSRRAKGPDQGRTGWYRLRISIMEQML